jgi:hypothetical protein
MAASATGLLSAPKANSDSARAAQQTERNVLANLTGTIIPSMEIVNQKALKKGVPDAGRSVESAAIH